MQFGTRLTLAAAVVVLGLVASSASAQDPYTAPPGPQLFAQQYSQGMGQTTAQMYVAPVPTPAWVGHTYYTYQPFYPHEILYRHTDRYHNYYDGGQGLNRTKAHYSTAPVQSFMRSMMGSFSLPRRY